MADEADRRALFTAIGRSLDVKAFMNTDGGRALVARANAVIEEAKEGLLHVQASDTEAIRQLQQKAAAAALLLDSMGEIETEGEQAQATVQDSED